MIYPNNFEIKIGFDDIRHILKGFCLSPLGKSLVDEMAFSADAAQINEWLQQVGEFRKIQEGTEEFPLENFYDLREQIARLKIAGTHLEEQELFDLKRSLQTVCQIVSFLRRNPNGEGLSAADYPFPALYRLTADILTFPEIVQAIDRILDKFGRIKDSASEELLRIRKELSRLQGSISHTLNSILRSAQSEGLVEKDITPTVRDGRLVIPVSPGLKRRISGIVHDESASGKTVFIEPTEVVEANNRIRELENEKTDYENNNSEIENKITGYQAEIEALTEKQKQNAANIERLNNEKLELERDTVKLRQLERDKTSERELASNEFSRLEERKASKQKEFDDIISKLWEEYELTRREAEEQAIEIENLTEARSRLSSLKNKIKALGSVNTGAIEEYKEVSERYTFMKTQVDDVEKSKKEIENLIVNLTKQMKEVFVDSFGEINRNFTVTFKELFGGGEGHLELSDPENILTSGIDIIVHPPGKIVVHLEALSGGEKALVAIALYFAIMKVRPAPFCVMDEIEAALDEVNVDRFASYLRNLTSSTQFILITHRRGTMEEADVLYGVTMQDEGISKLLELRASEVAARLGMKAN